MALQAQVRRLKVQLSDVDRGVYETLDLRLAQHPSETELFLVTRALAYCLCFEEGIEFGHGLSNVDEPALWIKTPDGRIASWIEVGTPSAERLHRASKAAPRVCVFTQHDPQLLVRDAAKTPIHRAHEIELYAPAPALLRALAERVERAMSWELSLSGGQLYVSVGKESFEGELQRLSLV
ncbi:MAG TPA: YaeQ family protein [Polyangiales bacterium]